jgi:hypothetical protein
MADAAIAAFNTSINERYLATFRRAREWFHGKNSLALPLAERRRGSCFDGLEASGANQNQGAESTLAFLWTEIRGAGNHHPHTDKQWAPAESV